METVLTQLSSYMLNLLFVIYTLSGFLSFSARTDRQDRRQTVLWYSIHAICFLVLYVQSQNEKIIWFYGVQVVTFSFFRWAYRYFYAEAKLQIWNHVWMFITISLAILTRLSYDTAVKQFVMLSIGFFIFFFLPKFLSKERMSHHFGIFYAGIGIGLLILVFFLGEKKYGATNWISIFGFQLQPSEFVKLLFVFFAAAMLIHADTFRKIVEISLIAAVFVMLLVLERDLGGALIFFVTYIAMLYLATEQALFLFSGFGAGACASVMAYRLFSHVKTRVVAWQDPWKTIDAQGYQVAQSLFAIGSGGWFGFGLFQGMPETIPVVQSDFLFSAISEEMGAITAICILLLCLQCFLCFVSVAMRLENKFYRLVAFGFAILYFFQVLLNIGGATKWIPSTGVTLPWISYGGSSAWSTMILFWILQGLSIRSMDEEEEDETKGIRQ